MSVHTKMRFLVPPCRQKRTYRMYQYRLPCTAIYQVYRIPSPDVGVNFVEISFDLSCVPIYISCTSLYLVRSTGTYRLRIGTY